jgi:hypothetical protein
MLHQPESSRSAPGSLVPIPSNERMQSAVLHSPVEITDESDRCARGERRRCFERQPHSFGWQPKQLQGGSSPGFPLNPFDPFFIRVSETVRGGPSGGGPRGAMFVQVPVRGEGAVLSPARWTCRCGSGPCRRAPRRSARSDPSRGCALPAAGLSRRRSARSGFSRVRMFST